MPTTVISTYASVWRVLCLVLLVYCTVCNCTPLSTVPIKDDPSARKIYIGCFPGCNNPFISRHIPRPRNGSGGHNLVHLPPHDVGAVRTGNQNYDIYTDVGHPSTFALVPDELGINSYVRGNGDIILSLVMRSEFRRHRTFRMTLTSTVTTPYTFTSGWIAGDRGRSADALIPEEVVNSMRKEQADDFIVKMHVSYEYSGELR